uniref:RBR-type E3 ubiquitin transferase n=1 Tax=Geotrypetes seraphini TaxID=260995 RepID=A0A6P8SI46_GEOSA|nr:probable E3 ubiquitin-protein ligase RNF217 isoform X2 [Geotrypetes seraphini]
MSGSTESFEDIYTAEEIPNPDQSQNVKVLKKQWDTISKSSGITESKPIQSPSSSEQKLEANRTVEIQDSVSKQLRDQMKKQLESLYGPDGITGDQLEACPKILMSCGHAVEPTNLTEYCQQKIENGNFTFTCPYLNDGEECNKEWSYEEIRRNAFLSAKLREKFEEAIALKTMNKIFHVKQCPQCYTFVERKNPNDLSVKCIICSAVNEQEYFFCWQCLQEWKGPFALQDRCGNKNCRNQDLEILKSCPLIALLDTKIANCPSIRACPTCGKLVSHNQKGCKNVTCDGCKVEFCFACLELTSVCQAKKPKSWFDFCDKPIAPRQTSIPKWN